MHRLALVEDDPVLRQTLAISLTARKYTVYEAASGAQALSILHTRSPDLLIVDLGLPDMDGLTLINAIRESTRTPIIVLSARSRQSQKVDALEAGADDYLTKPFGLEELVARIRVALRRVEGAAVQAARRVTTDSFTLDFDARRALVSGEPVRLTPTEWRLLQALAQRPGRKVSTAELLAEVWGPGSERQSHYLRVYFSHLRRKLQDDPASPRHLITVPGQGYRFDP